MSRSSVSSLALALAALCVSSVAFADDHVAAPVRAGLKVHMDPATHAVVDEPVAPEAQAATVAPIEKPDYNRATMSTNRHGAVIMNLNGQVRMYSVATVTPSGEIEETCVTPGDVARHAHAHASAKEE